VLRVLTVFEPPLQLARNLRFVAIDKKDLLGSPFDLQDIDLLSAQFAVGLPIRTAPVAKVF